MQLSRICDLEPNYNHRSIDLACCEQKLIYIFSVLVGSFFLGWVAFIASMHSHNCAIMSSSFLTCFAVILKYQHPDHFWAGIKLLNLLCGLGGVNLDIYDPNT